MFDFEKLHTYRELDGLVFFVFQNVLKDIDDFYLQDQLKRALLSSLLNLAEGTGRSSNKDKAHFYTISRASIYESTAIVNILYRLDMIDDDIYTKTYSKLEDVSKMLFGLIRDMKKNTKR